MSSEKHTTGQEHLSPARLVSLASHARTHPHLEQCAFCMEQYAMLVTLERSGEDEAEADRLPHTPFRLAAQSTTHTADSMYLRQTWYLEGGEVLLRVFELPAHHQLIGYVICDPERLAELRIRFSGIDAVFRPSADGSFAIGERDIAIEPMTVTLDD